jgi:hypothetical protein
MRQVRQYGTIIPTKVSNNLEILEMIMVGCYSTPVRRM